MLELFLLSWRSLWRHSRRTILTIVSMGGAVALAVLFLAVADGMYGRLLYEVLRMQAGHLTVENKRRLEAPSVDLVVDHSGELRRRLERLPGVSATKALVLGQGVVSSADGSVGLALAGVEPAVEASLSPLPKRLVSGTYLTDHDERSAVIGAEMARQLKLEVGGKLVISTNNVDGQLVQEMVRVKGVFRTGSVDLDRHFAQIPIHFARKALGLRADQVTQLGIVLQDPDVQDHVLKEARAQLAGNPDVVVRPWQRILPELYTFMQVDKGSNYVFQVIILLMAMFTIFNTVLMSALERKREFAMMLALGTPLHRVSVQLLVESILLGVVGAVCGVLLGSGASLALDGLSLAQWMGDGFEVGGFLVDPVLRPKLTMVTTVGLGTVMVLVVALMSLVPMARLRQLRISDVFR